MAEVTYELTRRAEARLRAYIHPNVPADGAQEIAFGRAVACQAEYDAEHADAIDAAARGVHSFTAGGYSETYFDRQGEGGTEVCPESKALLLSAGLLRRAWPTARRV